MAQNFEGLYGERLQALLAAAEESGRTLAGYGPMASAPELNEMLRSGSQEDERQLDTLKDLLRKVDLPAEGTSDEAASAVIQAGKRNVEAATDPALRDATIIDTLQATLLYYAAAYRTLASIARRLGRRDEVQALTGLQDHMRQKDEAYAALAERLASVGAIAT